MQEGGLAPNYFENIFKIIHFLLFYFIFNNYKKNNIFFFVLNHMSNIFNLNNQSQSQTG